MNQDKNIFQFLVGASPYNPELPASPDNNGVVGGATPTREVRNRRFCKN